jgi:hypothetical protein
MTGPEKSGVRVDPHFVRFVFGLMAHPKRPYANNISLLSRMNLYRIAQLSGFLHFTQS